VMNPLGGGLIPRNPKMFAHLTEGTDLTVAQAALRFVISHEEVTVALNGFSNKAQVDDAVIAAKDLKQAPAKEILARYEGKGAGHDDFCTGCNYCAGCPQGIPVAKYMDVYNEILLGGDPIFRLNIVWMISSTDAGRCVGCGLCEQKCTQHLPIMERLKRVAALDNAPPHVE